MQRECPQLAVGMTGPAGLRDVQHELLLRGVLCRGMVVEPHVRVAAGAAERPVHRGGEQPAVHLHRDRGLVAEGLRAGRGMAGQSGLHVVGQRRGRGRGNGRQKQDEDEQE